MFNIYREIRRRNLTVQKVAPITARKSRREEARRLTARPIRTSTPSDGKTNATKNQLFPYRQHKNRAQNFHNTVTTRRNRTEITAKKRPKLVTTTIARLCAAVIKTKNLRTFRKKHINLGATAVEERKKDRIPPSESLKKRPSHSKNNKIEATAAENIITV